MKWRWICLTVALLMTGCSTNTGSDEMQNKPLSGAQDPVVEKKEEPGKENEEEKKVSLIRRYVEAVYESGEKDLQKELKDVVSEAMLKNYAAGTNAAIDAREYTAQIEDPFYYANEEGAVAIFTIVSTTEIHVTRQSYVLQVRIENDRISEILCMEALER